MLTSELIERKAKNRSMFYLTTREAKCQSGRRKTAEKFRQKPKDEAVKRVLSSPLKNSAEKPGRKKKRTKISWAEEMELVEAAGEVDETVEELLRLGGANIFDMEN